MKEDTWKRFINGDEGVLTSLPTNIADSWKNCHSHQEILFCVSREK